ncbi:MAG: response regulator [Nitrososphaeraceae archaeon]
MRFVRLLTRCWLRICSDIYETIEPKQAVRMRTLISTPAFAEAGIHALGELNQAQYDKAITDNHIRSLDHDMGIIGREASSETEMSSEFTKATNIVMNGPMKNKNMRKLRRIMIVDDEQDVTFLFKIILEDLHRDPTFTCKVDSFNNSLVALENFREGLYDLIIIDIVMPKMDGFKLYKELRKKDKNVKVCFLTAGEMYYEEYRKHAFPEVSADKIIRKPVSNDELVRTINGYFET